MRKVCVLTVVLAIGFITVLLTAAIGSLQTYFSVHTSGRIEYTSADFVAPSGSIEDVQATVDQAVDYANTKSVPVRVMIPPGDFLFEASGGDHVAFDVPASGMTIEGAGINITILHLPSATSSSAPATTMMEARGHSLGRLRVTGITFRGRGNSNINIGAGDTGLTLNTCRDFRVDHCGFDGKLGSNGIDVYSRESNGGDEDKGTRGLVDNCKFADIFVQKCWPRGTGYAYGVGVGWYDDFKPGYWVSDVWSIAGHYDDLPHCVVIEDCTFSQCRHALVHDGGAILVFRHNRCFNMSTYYSIADVDLHPVREYGDSGRWMEVYDNDLQTNGIYFGGGSGLCFNNYIHNAYSGFYLQQGEWWGSQGWPRCAIRDVWIWNNTCVGCTHGDPPNYIEIYVDPAVPGNLQPVYNETKPSHAYTPYPYPHPLRQEQSSSAQRTHVLWSLTDVQGSLKILVIFENRFAPDITRDV